MHYAHCYGQGGFVRPILIINYAWSRTRMGGWAVAQSPILGTTITLSRHRRKVYESMLSYYLNTQPQFQ